MRNYLFLFTILMFFIVSCAGIQRNVKVIEQKPEVPSYIMGDGNVSADKMAAFLLMNNPGLNSAFVSSFARIYIEEASFEGVNHDIAFTQMCLETGFLRFGGDVKSDQYNFAGLGAVGGGAPGLSFPDPRTGVRAQIQHLKAYGSAEPLNEPLVNPRFRYVRRGSSPTIEGLAGTWAADRQYAVKINTILQRLYDFSF
ncbi:MAG: glucosaminidase domain-containing protein [Treponema sp.]|nr:glucosaminidase domain-containing protein [Treponema sp.]